MRMGLFSSIPRIVGLHGNVRQDGNVDPGLINPPINRGCSLQHWSESPLKGIEHPPSLNQVFSGYIVLCKIDLEPQKNQWSRFPQGASSSFRGLRPANRQPPASRGVASPVRPLLLHVVVHDGLQPPQQPTLQVLAGPLGPTHRRPAHKIGTRSRSWHPVGSLSKDEPAQGLRQTKTPPAPEIGGTITIQWKIWIRHPPAAGVCHPE